MKIVVRQISGLGNQLFQHAAGRYFAAHYHGVPSIVIDRPDHQVSHGYARPFLLPEFCIESELRPLSKLDRLLSSERRSTRSITQAIKRTLRVQLYTEPIAQRYTFLPELPLQSGVRTVHLSGYWQAHQYAASVEQQVRADLAFRHAPEGRTLEMLQRIAAAEHPVSLHVRRGDYTLAVEGNIALPLDYYQQAIAAIQNRFRNPTFFVFSDDMAFCRSAFASMANTVFVDHNDDFTAHDDLRLMAACHHHIIANSSFSWWGAWLDPRENKTVFAPKYWLLKQSSYFPDLFPAGWNVVPF